MLLMAAPCAHSPYPQLPAALLEGFNATTLRRLAKSAGAHCKLLQASVGVGNGFGF